MATRASSVAAGALSSAGASASTGAASASVRRTRIGVIGATGQLGTCLVRAIGASPNATLAFATTRQDLDLADPEAPSRFFARYAEVEAAGGAGPHGERGLDVVVNAAAHTKVDSCESEVELAYQLNAHAPKRLAEQAIRYGFRLFQPSTDYVFAGDSKRAYRETDATDPKTVYGASKRVGEEGVLETASDALVLRTSWLFGPGRNFVVAILDQAGKRRRGEAHGPLSVVSDQLGSPTYAADLATALLEIATSTVASTRSLSGLLHLSNTGETSWFGFARAILDASGCADIPIEPVPTGAFKTKAPRPAFSVLDCSLAKTHGIELPDWRDALLRYLSGPDRPRLAGLEDARNGPANEVPT